ncbi:MAG TPA: ribbon-helix-helix domain-containing protein [Acidimicrobiales bacterium]|nr:ribbon-helix-helix domain-containing protein [Acidimicrobiales bacterium]
MPTKGPAVPAEDHQASWEESHQRVTFHCPRSLLARIEKEMARSGRSKTRVIVDAVQAALEDQP